jgi:dTDP-4-amino-4,6-dideoxygalactose transaminase
VTQRTCPRSPKPPDSRWTQLAYFKQVVLIPPGGTPGLDALFKQLLSLPIYPRLTDDQVDAMCTAIADIVCRQSSREGAE